MKFYSAKGNPQADANRLLAPSNRRGPPQYRASLRPLVVPPKSGTQPITAPTKSLQADQAASLSTAGRRARWPSLAP